MRLAKRLYQKQEDYWRIREFLRRVFALNNRRELSWQVYRFDYWRWHGIENIGHAQMDQDVFIWEAADGQIAAVLNPESPGTAFLQVHPGLRTRALEEEMLTLAEVQLATARGDSPRNLWVFCHGDDSLRQDVLSRRGYKQTDFTEHHHVRRLSGTDAEPLPDISVAAGYSIRALGDVDELPARSWASWKAFHPNDPDDQYEGWEWYRNVQRAPLVP